MKIVLLGATGSIGTSACNCIRRFPEKFRIVGMSANNNIEKLAPLVREFKPSSICLGNSRHPAPMDLGNLAARVFYGEKGLEDLVEETEFDVLLNALVGAVGLRATVAALKKKKKVALANKESLVIGGELINGLIENGRGEIIPIDSEHSAILQCLCGEKRENIESIILTASGGPFREIEIDALKNMTPGDALNHPTWSMGKKITIDSATLMNKGFEVIEAHHLFHLPYDNIRVLIHPQSIIHSMVEFHDGAIMAQMGVPDMELPIQFALGFPERLPLKGKRLDLAAIKSLTFFEPDFKRFPCLKLCIDAARQGGTAPAIVNAANEMAVKFFLDGVIGYPSIAEIIESSLTEHTPQKIDGIEVIERADAAVRNNLKKRYAR
jgi:1-deoxy-D-xylulose-5-phosphate reductoisomerase